MASSTGPRVRPAALPQASERTGLRARRGKSRWQRVRSMVVPYLFVLPTMALLALFMYIPAATALDRSLYAWDGVTRPVFVGLANFSAMVTDPIMQQSFVNVLKLAAFAVTVQAFVPLLVARFILSLRSTRLQYVVRVLFVIPLIVPQVVLFLIWGFLYDPDYGAINQILGSLHLEGLTQAWLGDPKLALYAIMFIAFPFVDGFGLLIYTAGLQAIPSELTQAAAIDGAGTWSRFWRIELPLVIGQIRLIMVLNMIWAIQSFTSILILTQGGPGNATYVPGLALYWNAFQYEKMGYACAIGAVLFVVMLGLTFINLKYVHTRNDFDPAHKAA